MVIARSIRMLEVLRTPGALSAALTWPRFSLAAFQIVSRLRRAGVHPSVIIDVGANVGQFAVAALRMWPGVSVHPIEPDPRVAQRLRRNIGEEVGRNIRVTAIGDACGTARFHVNSDPQVSSLLNLGADRVAAFPTSRVVEEMDVPVSTLDSLFADRKLGSPILLKIDVQGFEDRVIAGAMRFLREVTWVLMETSFSRLYEGESEFEAIADRMREAGFRFVRPINFHLSPSMNDIIEMDALFARVGRAE